MGAGGCVRNGEAMGRGKRGRGGRGPSNDALGAVYEGPEVLSALLAQAGSPFTAEEVAERFAAAQSAGEERSEAIPALFEEEPRFPAPDAARRLYANLFGLWARIAAGLGPVDDAPEAMPDVPQRVPPPERGSQRGDRLGPDFIEAMWKYIAGLAPRERRRLEDRFEVAQPDLLAWLAGTDLPEAGSLSASDLVLESWAMFDQAFDERLGTLSFLELRSLEAEPPPLESEQPALAAYVAEQLDTLADEDPDFGPPERAQVERMLAAVAAALTRNVQAE